MSRVLIKLKNAFIINLYDFYKEAKLHGEHHDPNLVKVSTYYYKKQEVDQKIAFIAQVARYQSSSFEAT
jgi:hypothetical protein